jgi:hypothetical protein
MPSSSCRGIGFSDASLSVHSLVLEDVPEIFGPGQEGEDHGDVLEGMYAPCCTTLEQSRIQGSPGAPVTGSGAAHQ